MDMQTMMMLMQSGLLGGGKKQQPEQPSPQPQVIQPMMTAGGQVPSEFGQGSLFQQGAYRDPSAWGRTDPNSAVGSDSLLNMAHRVRNPTLMDSIGRGWNGFGQSLEGIDPNMRLMMGMQGLSDLGRILGGRA